MRASLLTDYLLGLHLAELGQPTHLTLSCVLAVVHAGLSAFVGRNPVLPRVFLRGRLHGKLGVIRKDLQAGCEAFDTIKHIRRIPIIFVYHAFAYTWWRKSEGTTTTTAKAAQNNDCACNFENFIMPQHRMVHVGRAKRIVRKFYL